MLCLWLWVMVPYIRLRSTLHVLLTQIKIFYICTINNKEMQRVSRKYLVVYEVTNDGYSAYVPDLLGCTSAGASREEVEDNIIEAIKLHLEILAEDGAFIPPSVSYSQMLVIV
jgi:predicted RNase H-like HicB family nuclease